LAFLTLLLVSPLLAAAETYNVGAVLILTSDQAVYGKAMQEGMEIAVEDCSAKLKPHKRQIKVFYEDGALRPKQAHTAAMKLISQNSIVAAVNSAFSEVMANGQLFERYKIPAITLWDSSRQIEQLGDYNFAIGLWTPSSAEVSSQFALNQVGARWGLRRRSLFIHRESGLKPWPSFLGRTLKREAGRCWSSLRYTLIPVILRLF